MKHLLLLLLIPAAMTLGADAANGSDVGYWSATGPVVEVHQDRAATLLSDGRVLVSGGSTAGNPVTSAEIYTPSTNTWAPAAPMSSPRSRHSSTLLPDGRVLVVGGLLVDTVEIYDPQADEWQPGPTMQSIRSDHEATRLNDGRVLITGGMYFINAIGVSHFSSILFDPETEQWLEGPDMNAARRFHTSTLLPSGKVLVTGGWSSVSTYSNAQLYNPLSNQWESVPDMAAARNGHSADLLPDGRVLVAGGTNSPNGPTHASVEMYDPGSNTWSMGPSMQEPASGHYSALLPDGRVFIIGRFVVQGDRYRPLIYNPDTEAWSIGPHSDGARGELIRLGSGKLLMLGGVLSGAQLFSTECFQIGDCDRDLVSDEVDNCPSTPNPNQANADSVNQSLNRPGSDGLGNVCDDDDDGDGWADWEEAWPYFEDPSTLQYCLVRRADADHDGAVSILDLTIVAGYFTQSSPPAPERLKQDADTLISILDLTRMAGVFTQTFESC